MVVVREVYHRWKQLSDLATADLSLLAAAWRELQVSKWLFRGKWDK